MGGVDGVMMVLRVDAADVEGEQRAPVCSFFFRFEMEDLENKKRGELRKLETSWGLLYIGQQQQQHVCAERLRPLVCLFCSLLFCFVFVQRLKLECEKK